MTAPVPMLNLAVPVGPAGAASAAAAGGPLAGFEALLAALFGAPQPQAAQTGAPEAPVTPPGQAEAPAAGEGQDEPEAQAQTPNPEPPVDGPLDPPLLGLLSAGEPTETVVAPAPETADEAVSPAWGREKTKAEPAAPAFAHASPNASFQEADAAPDAPPPPVTAHGKAEPPPQAQATFQRAAAPLPVEAGPAAPPAPAPAPAPAPTAAEAEAPTPQPPTAPPIPAAATMSAVAPKAAPAQPPAQPQAQPARGERARAAQPDAASAAPARAPAASAKAPGPALSAAEAPSPEVVAEAASNAAEAADTPEPTTPAAESRAQASAGPASSATPPPVRGAPETVANLAAQIVKKLDGRSTRFDLELTPAGLGKVDVRLEIAAHGRITAAMTFENPQAAAELKARSGELQRTLEQAGFDLSGGLSFDVAGDRGQARQGWGEAGAERRFPGEAFWAALDNAEEAEAAAASGALRLRRGVTAGVDVRI